MSPIGGAASRGMCTASGAGGITIGSRDNVYAADIVLSRVVPVSPSGAIDTIASEKDGLDDASGVAFGGARGEPTMLYITNFAIAEFRTGRGTPHPSLTKVDVGVPGVPLIGAP